VPSGAVFDVTGIPQHPALEHPAAIAELQMRKVFIGA